MQRTRDIHPPARGAAFRMLGNYVNVRNLKISQRTQLISDGLRDRDEKVQRECAKMCLTWLDNCDKDVLALLRMVDVEVAEEGAELLLRALFRDAQGAAPVRIEPTEALSSEAALYMRVLAQYWKDHVGDAASQEAFEQQVPELTSICDMMRINAGNDFALKQLLLYVAGRRMCAPTHSSCVAVWRNCAIFPTTPVARRSRRCCAVCCHRRRCRSTWWRPS